MNKNILNWFIFIILSVILADAQEMKMSGKKVFLIDSKSNCRMRYYYYPNLEAYFDTDKKTFYYIDNGEWKTTEELPNGYRGYSMYNKYSVYITDYDDDNIYQFLAIHKKKYPYITSEKLKKLTASTY